MTILVQFITFKFLQNFPLYGIAVKKQKFLVSITLHENQNEIPGVHERPLATCIMKYLEFMSDP